MIEIVDGYLVNDDNVKIAFTNRNVDAKSSEDMKRFSDKYGFNYSNIVFNTQVHGADVRIVESEADITDNGKEADGLITNLKEIPLLIFTADCVPVVFYDKKQGVVALAHAGWRGTYGNIAGEMISIMRNKYGCKVEDVKTIIGPSVSVDNYEVSYDLIEKFAALEVQDYYKENDGKYYLDLWQLNKELLKKCGILEDNIKIIDFCTVRDNDKFFSYRLDDATPKRIGTIIQLD
ncbi:peptidoglycan editing factor PgeF [uncultured Gemella sp.]|uniref:peptidoglycan editing factor PgeF n=1 Tax=uncultured Gemella sp. TaxID=254352 RepID=UPI0028D2C361|nr:peptidoglycan editing factor PgeF [uncultured Gemella sp.]